MILDLNMLEYNDFQELWLTLLKESLFGPLWFQLTATENPEDIVNSDDSCFVLRQFSLGFAVVLALNCEACLYLSIDH